MTLAEALAQRADARRRVEQLRVRIVGNARHQEGETPSEDAAALLAEAEEVLGDLETLIRRINRTNAATDLGPDGTMTDALARRDVLRMRHAVLTAAADAATGRGDGYRQLRSELRQLSALPVAELRARADRVARELRELDVRIQRANWEVELLDRGGNAGAGSRGGSGHTPRVGGSSGPRAREGQRREFDSPDHDAVPARRTGEQRTRHDAPPRAGPPAVRVGSGYPAFPVGAT